MDTVTSKEVIVGSRELLRESVFPPLPLKRRGFQKGTVVNILRKKESPVLIQCSVIVCLIAARYRCHGCKTPLCEHHIHTNRFEHPHERQVQKYCFNCMKKREDRVWSNYHEPASLPGKHLESESVEMPVRLRGPVKW